MICKFGFLLAAFVASTSALSGGSNSAAGAWPSFVAVVLPNNNVCGGHILNANHVLTSALCLVAQNFLLLNPNQVSVLAGVTNINFNTPRINARALYTHPDYNPFTNENDVAVIRLVSSWTFVDNQMPMIWPSNLNTRIVADNTVCVTVAWNNNNQQQINVPVVNRDACNALPLNFGRIAESMMCVGNLGTGAGVCQHNRGGGVFCNNQLSAILVGGFGCGQANNPGQYTQVRYHTAWINQQLVREDIPIANSLPVRPLP